MGSSDSPPPLQTLFKGHCSLLVMFDLFGEVKSLIKLDKVCIDNNIFRLHYKVTFIILLTSGILVTSKQYIGDPIDCIVEGIPEEVMDTYCWIHSTFSVSSKVLAEIGSEAPHPGVGPVEEDGLKYHKYYQWVCFTLFFQAILFYIPRYLWKLWEAGKMKMLAAGLNVPIVDTVIKKDRLSVLLAYFHNTSGSDKHTWYAARFFFCEFLNLVNVIGQIYFVDFFLDGEFTTYGSEVWSMMEQSQGQRIDPMSKVFPKMTKCTFHKFGPSGTIQKFDGLCILPVNIINEKIYFFLWFWLVGLAIITGAQQVYRLITVLVPGLQVTRMKSLARAVPEHKIRELSKRTSTGDWFLLSQMGKNMDSLMFRDFLDQLADKMSP